MNKIQTLKYSEEWKAREVASRTDKPQMIILGDDGRFWLVCLADGEKLLKAGYETLQIRSHEMITKTNRPLIIYEVRAGVYKVPSIDNRVRKVNSLYDVVTKQFGVGCWGWLIKPDGYGYQLRFTPEWAVL